MPRPDGYGVLIDLGEVGAAAGPALPAVAAGPRRRAPRLYRHWPAALGVLAVVLATLGAAGAVTRLEPAFTLRVSAWAVALDDRNAYVSTGSGPAAALTAYRLADGRQVWQRTLDGRGSLDVAAVPGSPAIVTGRCPDLTDALTTVVDPATGRHRWLFAGVPIGAAAGGRVLMLTSDGACRSDRYDTTPPRASTISAVDPETGRVRWRVPVGPAQRLSVATGTAGIETVLLVDPDGRVSGYRSDTGALALTTELPQLARAAAPRRSLGTLPGPAGPPRPELTLAGSQLLVWHADSSTVRVQAYRVGRDGPQWQRTLPRVPSGAGTAPRLAGCPPWVCLVDSAQVMALAPQTGSTVWRRELSEGRVEGARLLGYERAGAGGLRLVDARSGFDLLDLTGWQPLPALLAPAGPVLLGRPDAGATRFATLDPATGVLRVLGAAGGAVQRCGYASPRLVCTDGDGAVRAWRVPA